MKEKYNPFLIKGYESAELFCDRENEVAKLYQHMQNGIDTTIGSPADVRRIVKALIEKELVLETITKTEIIYQVYDVFLSRWMEKEY